MAKEHTTEVATAEVATLHVKIREMRAALETLRRQADELTTAIDRWHHDYVAPEPEESRATMTLTIGTSRYRQVMLLTGCHDWYEPVEHEIGQMARDGMAPADILARLGYGDELEGVDPEAALAHITNLVEDCLDAEEAE